MDDIRSSALRLISRHLDFDSLMENLERVDSQYTPLQRTQSAPEGESAIENAIYESMKLQASLSEMRIEVTASQLILKKLCQVSQNHEIICEKCNDIFATISAFEKVGSALSAHDLSQYQGNFKHCLPLNVLLQLHDRGLLALKEFLIVHVKNKTIMKEFVWALQHMTKDIRKTSATTQLETIAGIMTHLISYAYSSGAATSKALKKLCGYILFTVLKCHLQHLITLPASKFVSGENQPILHIISENLQGCKETLRKSFTQMITLWVTDSPNLKVSDAIMSQHTWITSKQNEALTIFYKEMASNIGLENAVSTLNTILERREVNWKHLLTFTSALLVSFSDSTKNLNGLISQNLKSGIETHSVELLATSFLLARQLSLEGSHAFTSYTTWFQDNFGAHSTLISSYRSFRFFLRFLTDIAPYEPVRYLKAHVVKPPHAPPSCTEKLNKYTSIARVRIAEHGASLADLKDDSTQSDETEKDVKTVLDEYEKTKRIPKSLMEASIFQKAYFCKKFLPTLLKPRPLPAVPDTLNRLIEDLVKAQKVPRNMYTAYLDDCKKENAKLLQEVMILDDDSAFEDEEEPSEQFTNILKALKREILQNLSKENSQKESTSCELLTKLSRLLHTLCNDKPVCEPNIIVNLCTEVGNRELLSQMVNALLNWFGELKQRISEMPNSSTLLSRDLTKILKVLQEHEMFNAEICKAVWRCCANEISSASDLKLQGISLYMNIVGSSLRIRFFPPSSCIVEILNSKLFVKSVENWKNVATADLTDAVSYCLQYYQGKDYIMAAFRFACYTIECAESLKQDPNPIMLDVFTYLGCRIQSSIIVKKGRTALDGYPPPKCPRSEEHELLKWYNVNEKLRHRLSLPERELSRARFLSREMKIDTTEDILTKEERCHLYSDVFFSSDISKADMECVFHVILDDFCFNEEKSMCNSEVTAFIFKSIPLMMEGCAGVISNAQFVYDIIKWRVERSDGKDVSDLFNDIRWRNETSALLSVLINLPSSFLFDCHTLKAESDNIWDDCCEKDVKTRSDSLIFVAKVVDEYFFRTERNSSDMFSLSHAISHHILSGLLKCIGAHSELLQFLVVSCPCLFVSLMVHWSEDPSLQYLMKIRNPNLYSIVCEVHASLSRNGSIFNAYKILLEVTMPNGEKSSIKSAVNLCLGCSFLDLAPRLGHMSELAQKMNGFDTQMLGYLASCAILKISDSVLTTQVSGLMKSMLECALNAMEVEYTCCTVMRSKLLGISHMAFCKFGREGFIDVCVLRALSAVTLPQSLLRSEFFLPAFLHLEQSARKFFEDSHTLMVGCSETPARMLESRALKNAPDITITNTLKGYAADESLNGMLRHEAAKRRLVV